MTHNRVQLVLWTVVVLAGAGAHGRPRSRGVAFSLEPFEPLVPAANRTSPASAISTPSAPASAAAAPAAAPRAPAPRNPRQVPPSLPEELRLKRNPLQTVPIMHAEEIGMCKFVVQEDTDPERTPQTIYTVTCRRAGCQCGSEGDYRCTQLTSEVRVTYRNGARNQVLYPNSGCICAAKEASDALSGAPQIAL